MDSILFLTIFLVFFLGAIFGSFLNVVAIVLEKVVFSEKGFFLKMKDFWVNINRRSKCPKCSQKLNAIDLFPVFSYIFLGGKCRACSKKISIRYFLVEIFSGLVFLVLFGKIWMESQSEIFLGEMILPLFLNYSFWLEFIFFLPILCGLILIFLFDLRHKIIPDVVLIPTFLYSIVFILFDFQKNSLVVENFLDDIFRSFSFAVPFFAIWFFSQGRAMGFADWKLIFLLSLFFNNALQNLLFVFGSFWVGAIYSIPLLVLKKKNLKTQVPFGPFILISFFLVYFFDLSYYFVLNLF